MTNVAQADNARRFPTLDLLRVIAISMTMMLHAPSLTTRIPLVKHFTYGLWLGVDLFMLISGWLLGGQVLREARTGLFDVRRFYLKRWLRTLPPYYAMLLLLYFSGAAPFAGMTLGELGAHFAFMQTYLDCNLYGVSWSLCVEEHFYLVLPWLILALGTRHRFAKLTIFVLAAEGFAIASRIYTLRLGAAVPHLTHMRCDGLFLGVLLAFVAQEEPALWKRMGRHATSIGLVGLVAFLAVGLSLHPVDPASTNPWIHVGAATVGTWALAMLFLPCVHSDSALSRVAFPGLMYAGELTYSIYLVHDVLPKALVGENRGVVGAIWRLFLVLVGSALLHHAVERPFMRLRAMLLARRKERGGDAHLAGCDSQSR